jgi:hypothetical protein
MSGWSENSLSLPDYLPQSPCPANPRTDLTLTNRIHSIRISSSNAPASSELALCFHREEIPFIAAIDFCFQNFPNRWQTNNELDHLCQTHVMSHHFGGDSKTCGML